MFNRQGGYDPPNPIPECKDRLTISPTDNQIQNLLQKEKLVLVRHLEVLNESVKDVQQSLLMYHSKVEARQRTLSGIRQYLCGIGILCNLDTRRFLNRETESALNQIRLIESEIDELNSYHSLLEAEIKSESHKLESLRPLE